MATCSFTISKIWVILLIDGIHEGLGLLRFIHQTTDCFLYPVPSQTYKSSWAAVIHLDMYLLAVWSSWFVLNILHPGWEKKWKKKQTKHNFFFYNMLNIYTIWRLRASYVLVCSVQNLIAPLWHVTCDMWHVTSAYCSSWAERLSWDRRPWCRCPVQERPPPPSRRGSCSGRGQNF